jgi:acyl-CoA thioesterase
MIPVHMEDLMSGDIMEKVENNPFRRMLGINVYDVGDGKAKASLKASDVHGNIHGTVHGAVLFAVSDAAFEAAVNSMGRTAVAVQVDIQYLAAAKVGDNLTAEGIPVRVGRKMAGYRLELRNQENKLISVSQATAFFTE